MSLFHFLYIKRGLWAYRVWLRLIGCHGSRASNRDPLQNWQSFQPLRRPNDGHIENERGRLVYALDLWNIRATLVGALEKNNHHFDLAPSIDTANGWRSSGFELCRFVDCVGKWHVFFAQISILSKCNDVFSISDRVKTNKIRKGWPLIGPHTCIFWRLMESFTHLVSTSTSCLSSRKSLFIKRPSHHQQQQCCNPSQRGLLSYVMGKKGEENVGTASSLLGYLNNNKPIGYFFFLSRCGG